jgi:hypothetical protein
MNTYIVNRARNLEIDINGYESEIEFEKLLESVGAVDVTTLINGIDTHCWMATIPPKSVTILFLHGCDLVRLVKTHIV